MSYEAGSKECRQLIEAKENLLNVMESLSAISETESISFQLKDIYNTLEELHDRRRILEETANS